VVDKFLVELQVQLDDKNVYLQVDEEAIDWFVAHGYDKAMGARPMLRLIQTKIKKPLAEDILFGKLIAGGEVQVSVANDDILLEITAANNKSKSGEGRRKEEDADA